MHFHTLPCMFNIFAINLEVRLATWSTLSSSARFFLFYFEFGFINQAQFERSTAHNQTACIYSISLAVCYA